jgi:hypothetical protein
LQGFTASRVKMEHFCDIETGTWRHHIFCS